MERRRARRALAATPALALVLALSLEGAYAVDAGPGSVDDSPLVELGDLGELPPQPTGPKASISARGAAGVARSGGKLFARVPLAATCPEDAGGPCSVTANLSGRSGVAIAASLGASHRSLAPGLTWAAQVPLNKRAAKAFRSSGRIKVVGMVAAQTPDGQISAETARFTLRRPKNPRR